MTEVSRAFGVTPTTIDELLRSRLVPLPR